ncbi:MAG: oxidoreductase [Elusimicrobia bacterium RIFOXYB2_FULL_48_7]|nr:MAG: oxidoreductase [Elusimicrobia bacterium RIFOXYB2_FULL_48_7]
MPGILNWGIIGTGNIASQFANGLKTSTTGKLYAVASRCRENADKFGSEFNTEKCYPDYESMLNDKNVDAVYIATPHPFHAEWAIKSARAGKHILCEKPIGMNYAEAMAIVEAARENNVFLMEAFMYRCHPQTQKLVELLKQKVIGDVMAIQTTFSYRGGDNLKGRHLSQELGGGGILDVGCYCTSAARLIAGIANGRDFIEPIEFKATGCIGKDSRVDEYTIAALKFPGNILAELSTGVRVAQKSILQIFGSEGNISVPSPWFCSNEQGISKILVTIGKETREIEVESKYSLYTVEADTVAQNIEKKQAPSPAMNWEDTLGNMRALDTWRTEIGLIYDSEKSDVFIPTADRLELKVKKNNMKYGKIEGVNKPISRLVMGTMLEGMQIQLPHASIMFDDFFTRGGNCFDTAYCYCGGKSERVLGQWIKNRNIREQVVIVGKGGHTPNCNPKAVNSQLLESLERLQMDYMDVYMLHRDNPEIPVGEFVDVLNEHKKAGRINSFGGSNWTIERLDAANKYAKSKGLAGFSVVSNNFSLARMVDMIWEGCVSSSDEKSRKWFEESKIPLMSWSSQARGFFTGRANPEDLSDSTLARCWYCEDNFKRLERVNELARKYNVLPINIALAYVLCQPFQVFALIGPRTLAEIRTSFQGVDIELTPDEALWLNLGK